MKYFNNIKMYPSWEEEYRFHEKLDTLPKVDKKTREDIIRSFQTKQVIVFIGIISMDSTNISTFQEYLEFITLTCDSYTVQRALQDGLIQAITCNQILKGKILLKYGAQIGDLILFYPDIVKKII